MVGPQPVDFFSVVLFWFDIERVFADVCADLLCEVLLVRR